MLITLAALMGKFAISASFSVAYLFSAELFPTQGRNLAMGLLSLVSRMGGIISPLTLILVGIIMYMYMRGLLLVLSPYYNRCGLGVASLCIKFSLILYQYTVVCVCVCVCDIVCCTGSQHKVPADGVTGSGSWAGQPDPSRDTQQKPARDATRTGPSNTTRCT